MNARRFSPLHLSLALSLTSVGWLGVGCNLGFDPSEFGPIAPEERDGGNNGNNDDEDVNVPDVEILGCQDEDEDGFGIGRECAKDKIDCDDTRSFVYPGAPEVCDGVDNDCDGSTDKELDGNPLRMQCYTGNPSELSVPATDCRQGFLLCTDGQFPVADAESCVGQLLPHDIGETSGRAKCDGLDNDCNGEVDPACGCPFESAEQECYEAGAFDLAGRGQCVMGTQRCLRSANGELNWGECVGDIAPGVETCLNEGTDNDCNGFDDDIPGQDDRCVATTPGVCMTGVMRCNDSGQLLCASVAEPTDEICNNLDDDCDGTADEGVRNSCGGCGTLAGVAGTECGQCGTWSCTSAEASRCEDPGLNVCGGCGNLGGFPGDSCGTCGTLVCNGDNSGLACDDPGLNVCGGCGVILGDPVGSACGVCGTATCDTTNATTCTDPGLNSCLACGTLAPAPGSSCGSCGYNACTETGTACVLRDCIPNSSTPLRSFRAFDTAVLSRTCQADNDCGDWGYCVPAIGDEPDTCGHGLIFSLLGNDYPLPLFFNNQTPYLTSSLISFITSAQIDVFVQNRMTNEKIRVSQSTITYASSGTIPQERTLVVSRRQESCEIAANCFFAPNPSCVSGQCLYGCSVNSDCTNGLCESGSCVFYNANVLVDNNRPTVNVARIRTLHSHLDFQAVDLTFTGQRSGQTYVLADDVLYGGISSFMDTGSYVTLPPDVYTAHLSTAAGLEIPLAEDTFTVHGGEVVSLIFQGRPGSTPAQLKLISDRELLPVLFDGN